jgi:hypothetical protein
VKEAKSKKVALASTKRLETNRAYTLEIVATAAQCSTGCTMTYAHIFADILTLIICI